MTACFGFFLLTGGGGDDDENEELRRYLERCASLRLDAVAFVSGLRGLTFPRRRTGDTLNDRDTDL